MLELNVWLQPFYFCRWKIFEKLKVLQAFDGAFQTAIVADFLGLVKVDVGMSAKLVEGHTIDIHFLGFRRMCFDKCNGRFWQSLDF